jgi:hypothetical protein
MPGIVNNAANKKRPYPCEISGGIVPKMRLISVILMSTFSNRSRESITNLYYFSTLLSIGAIGYLLKIIRILLESLA